MRICIIAEGCYPYAVGGVSSWVHSMIKAFPQNEFLVLTIVADRASGGREHFKYELPENVMLLQEVYLNDDDWGQDSRKRLRKKDFRVLVDMVAGQNPDWKKVFELTSKRNFSYNELLMGMDFLEAVKQSYRGRYTDLPFVDYLWTMRSMYLPLLLVMNTNVPKADLYHCVSTGYAGILGVMGKYKYDARLMISEHGIYTREREEELIKATWVKGFYKDIWIDQFRKMARIAYGSADIITALYDYARELQVEMGADPDKTIVTPNGIDMSRFSDIPGKAEEDEGYINIGAVARVAPIKDIKTMIRAFAFAKERVENIKLWIMGPYDEDEEYAKECFDIVEAMHLKDVVFTGRVDVTEYYGRMDFTILTSISEGQPLTILEGFAAKKPIIATDVGNCRGLIYGETDGFGQAGILTHIMNVEEIATAIVTLAKDPEMTRRMGEIGYKRLQGRYQLRAMRQMYENLYDTLDDAKMAELGLA